MISLENASKAFQSGGKAIHVLSKVNIAIPATRSIALFGHSPVEKKMFISLLAGTAMLSSGLVRRHADISFPVGSPPGLEKNLSVRKNVEYAARFYGANPKATVTLVEEILNIGPRFDQAFQQLSVIERVLFMSALPLSIPFDMYLFFDEINRGHRCWDLFRRRQRNAGMLIPIKSVDFARANCDMALFINRGQVSLFQHLEEGIRFFERSKGKG